MRQGPPCSACTEANCVLSMIVFGYCAHAFIYGHTVVEQTCQSCRKGIRTISTSGRCKCHIRCAWLASAGDITFPAAGRSPHSSAQLGQRHLL